MWCSLQVQVVQEEHPQPFTHPRELKQAHGFSDVIVKNDGRGGGTSDHVADDARQDPQVAQTKLLERHLHHLQCSDASGLKFKLYVRGYP